MTSLPERTGRTMFAVIVLVLLSTTATSVGVSAETTPSSENSLPVVTHLRSDGHIALAWFYGADTDQYIQWLNAAEGVSVASPAWFQLNPDDLGTITSSADSAFVDAAHQQGIAVWPLLANLIDAELSHTVLSDRDQRARLVLSIAAEVHRTGVDGVNADFENMEDPSAPYYTLFIAELKAALPNHIISVDVVSMSDDWVLGNWSTSFDREGLAKEADYVMLMAYDQFNSIRRDGPVAGLPWVEEVTEYLLRYVPPEKLVLCVPFYSRDWADEPTATDGVELTVTLGMVDMAERLAQYETTVTFDETHQQSLYTYTDVSGRPHRVWLEDEESLTRRINVVEASGLAGVAAWRAGFEDPAVWTQISAQLAALPSPGNVVNPEPTPTLPISVPLKPDIGTSPAFSREIGSSVVDRKRVGSAMISVAGILAVILITVIAWKRFHRTR